MIAQRPDDNFSGQTTTNAVTYPPGYKDPREHVTARAVGIWLVALFTYIVAITGRTSLGVAGVEALDRFHINASQLAVFTAVQVGVYALAQIPTGIIIDRVGAKKTMVAGALIMALGQAILALTTSYPLAIAARVLIGAGDATAFLGAMRLLPAWFPSARPHYLLSSPPVWASLASSSPPSPSSRCSTPPAGFPRSSR